MVLLAASEQSPEYTQRISAAVKAHRAHKVSGLGFGAEQPHRAFRRSAAKPARTARKCGES